MSSFLPLFFYAGKFELTGIPPAPRGVPQIEVTFEIDANGILQVSAEDKGTGKSEKITITAEKGRLSAEEIERMVKEAEEFAEEDKKVKDKVDARNGLESYAYNVKTQLEDEEKGIAGKVDADDKETLSKAVQETLDWLDENASAEAEDFKEQQKKVSRGLVIDQLAMGLLLCVVLRDQRAFNLTLSCSSPFNPPPPVTAAGEGGQPHHAEGVRQGGRRARWRPRRRGRRRRGLPRGALSRPSDAGGVGRTLPLTQRAVG